MSKKTESKPEEVRYSAGIIEVDGKYFASDRVVKGKKSRFAPGDDARLKGVLQRATRAGKQTIQVEGVDGKTRRVNVPELVAEMGWGYLMAEPEGRTKKPKKATTDEVADLEPEEADEAEPALTDLAIESGVAKIGRATYQVDILSKSKDGSKLEIQYTTKKGDVKTTTIDADKVEIGASLQ